MKTIGIDCRFAGGISGLGRYTREIVSALLHRNDPVRYVLFVRSENEEWIGRLPAESPHSLQIADINHYSFAEQIRFPRIIRQSGIALLFSPHFNVPLLCPVPFVATVHDLILHRYPNLSACRQLAYRLQMAYTVRRAKALCAVSPFTALEICGAYGPKAHATCRVTGEGVGDAFTPATAESVLSVVRKYGLRPDFFLYIGSGKVHKNVSMLLEAFAALHDDQRHLVLVTGDRPDSSLPKNVLHLSQVEEADLPALYSAAACFVTASLYEGYGLPVAEALSSGCPVIAINCTAMLGTAAGAAVLVEPSAEAITDAMRSPPKRPVAYNRPQWSLAAEATAQTLLKALR